VSPVVVCLVYIHAIWRHTVLHSPSGIRNSCGSADRCILEIVLLDSKCRHTRQHGSAHAMG